MGRLAEAYKRWRHTRGYGVHSPFAYSIVRHVVRLSKGYAYYGYREIEQAAHNDNVRHSERHAKTLLRLSAFLDVKSTFLPNDKNAYTFRIALLAANRDMKISHAMADVDKCTLIATVADYMPLETLASLLAVENRIICFKDLPEGWREFLFDALPEGLMLHSRRNAILVHRPGMAKVAYSCIL